MILNSISTTSALVSCSTLLCSANHLCSSDCLVVSSSSEMSAVHKNVLTAAHLRAYLFRHARSSCANLKKCANPNIYINVHTFPHTQHPKNGLTVQKCFSCMTLLQKPSKVCEPQTTSWSVCFSMACSLTVQKYFSVHTEGAQGLGSLVFRALVVEEYFTEWHGHSHSLATALILKLSQGWPWWCCCWCMIAYAAQCAT